jgi:hypothetical protein
MQLITQNERVDRFGKGWRKALEAGHVDVPIFSWRLRAVREWVFVDLID